MHPRMNTPVNSTDPMHSMQQMAQAAALIVAARRMLADALKLVRDDWQWHHPADGWKIPDDIDRAAIKALEHAQDFNACVHWTINTLRKEAKP